MIVHFYTFSDARGGSSRQRAFQVVERLNARGMNARIHTPHIIEMSETPWPRKFRLIVLIIRSLFSIRKGDVIYLQRAVANKYFFAIMVMYLFLFRRKMIFDFDDPIYVYNFFKTKVFTSIADAVIVCTHGQADWARKYNQNIHIVHIALELSVYEAFGNDKSLETDECTIGWTGHGPQHLTNLKMLVPVLMQLARKSEMPLRFIVVGSLGDERVHALFSNIGGLSVKFVTQLDWTDPCAVPREIQSFDIGVVPHESEGEWNRSKSSFKVLEYMACGVPVVCSDFGEMSHIVENGIHGYRARSEDEWVNAILKLAGDRALRIRCGVAGQQRVREKYCFDSIIPDIMRIIESVARPS